MSNAEIAAALRLPEDQPLSLLTDAASALRPGLNYLSGVRGCGATLFSSELARTRHVVHVVADTELQARALADAQYVVAGDSHALGLSASEMNPYAESQPDRRSAMRRLSALSGLLNQPWRVLVVNAGALLRLTVPSDVIRDATTTIELEQELDLSLLGERLSACGYLRSPVVEDPGSFAVRGGILDVWGPDDAEPVRIELFGDEVLSLKRFDPGTQRTSNELSRVVLAPSRENVLFEQHVARARMRLRELCDEANYPSSKSRQLAEDITSGRQSFGISGYLPAFYELESIWTYLPKDCAVVIEDPTAVLKTLREQRESLQVSFDGAAERPRFAVESLIASEQQLERELGFRAVALCAGSFVRGHAASLCDRLEVCDVSPTNLAMSDHADLARAVGNARTSKGRGAALEPLLERLSAWREAGLNVDIVARASTQARRLASLLAHRNVAFSLALTPEAAADEPHSPLAEAAEGLTIGAGPLSRGVIAPLERRVLITEEEIFGQRVHKPQSKRRGRLPLADLRALQPGDYVVHAEHGVGRYLGLQAGGASGGGAQLELLVVEYTGGKLFLPVYRLNLIEKFSGAERPKLDRLGGQSFSRTKAKARKKAREMADELLRLYAERKAVQKEPLPLADDDYAAFEASFPFEETPDQAAAIADVSSDLERDQVMDRLVCGDVGFGKTEVALRAAFRCISAGRQVAVLCPTTVLAQQHLLTFSRRLADYPFEVRGLSRFQSRKEMDSTLEGLRKGSVDVVVGTHRVLSKDLQFKNLGLLVIDEEQRFGVVHKERVKQLRASVDVLTLTATPIPRTLQFALGGLREMSIISTPPIDRRAIRTIVSRPDEQVIQEAIAREIARGGQVFYVYNRVEGLYERAQRLQQLLPTARIAVGHGQMKEAMLERTMLDFVDGAYDVLVATSIVESGLDISRANTMIIDRADLFGLAQLYQLRGRVGRSQQRAYCYLLVPAPTEMTDDARSRIEALERYTELGSGFQIATLDMEIRGAGDILGADQSGTVQSVGLEMFCHMLEEASAELRGEEVVFDIDPELNFDVEALLPANYVEEVGVRLSLYKRLASATDENDVAHLAAEMEDRFGPPPSEAQRLVELMRIKVELRKLKVTVCEATRSAVSLRFRDDTPLDPPKLLQLVATQKAKFKLSPDGRLTRRRKDSEQATDGLDLADKMLEELQAALI